MKVKKFKRVCAMLMAVTMCFSLVACGGTGIGSNPSKNPTKVDGMNNTKGGYEGVECNKPVSTIGHNGEDYANYDPYAGIEKYRGTTVKFATWIDHAQTEAGKVFEDFEKKYGIKVELVYCSQARYVEEILALISAGNAPDVFVDGANFPFTLQIAQDMTVSGLDLNEPIWSKHYMNSCSVGDKVYGVNTVNTVWGTQYGVLYNRELMEANSIKTPAEYIEEGNWTWETMKYVMEQVDALGEEYYGGSIPDLIDISGTVGSGPVSYDYKTGTFTNTHGNTMAIKAGEYLAELTREGLTTAQEQFASGKVGLIIKDPYSIKNTGYYQSMDGLDLDFVRMPDVDANTKVQYSGNVRCYGIVKGAKNPEAAGYFLRYFLDGGNYDLEETFKSSELAQRYFDMNEEISKLDEDAFYFNYSGIALLIGQSAWNWMEVGAEPSQVATRFQKHKNEIDTTINKAMALIDKMR